MLLAKRETIRDPFEQAFFAMVRLPPQPFEDVNKRVSRLAANTPLIRADLAPLSFVDVPREEYIEKLLGGVRRTDIGAIRRSLQGRVDTGVLDDVVALVINELHQLNEGNIARYRLRPSESGQWLELQQGDEG